jgi:hypothetical protein
MSMSIRANITSCQNIQLEWETKHNVQLYYYENISTIYIQSYYYPYKQTSTEQPSNKVENSYKLL